MLKLIKFYDDIDCMEIINYVQNSSYNKREFSMPAFLQRKERKMPRIDSSIFMPEVAIERIPMTPSFSAHKVKSSFSIRAIFKFIGSRISIVQRFISSNIKKVILSVFLFILFCSGLLAAYFYFGYKADCTAPLVFEQSNTPDVENLNRLMAAFALDGIIEYDESGNLLNTDSFIPQVLTQPVTYKTYTVKLGDTISGITKKFGLSNLSTLISINDIGNVRQLAAGQRLKVPSIDGIIYTVKPGDTLESIIAANNVTMETLLDVNDLTSKDLAENQQLFLPGVALDSVTLRNAMGDLFKMPIAAPFRWTSMYGPRTDPIAGHKSFHTGVDMACPKGTPILASMSGRVTKTGVTRVYGNYVIIDHGNGYQTLYAHMSKIIATEGQWVNQGTRIGLVGSTGYSTGPHLHFTVYKNGQLVDPMSVLNK